MSELTIRAADFKEDFDEIYTIRDVVYIKGQDCPYDEEFDGNDKGSEHFLAYIGGEVVGYCRLRVLESKAKLERFAVYEQWRGRSIGDALVRHLLAVARERGIEQKYLYSQVSAKRFYEKLGFVARGELFMEAGIEHVHMYYDGGAKK